MESEFLVELSMREYETLRAEVLSTVERQYSLVNWGVSAIAVVVAAIVGGWATISSIPGMMPAILLFIVPTLMTVYVISWSHVITKINQLGARLHQIEENIAAAVGPELIQKTFSISPDEDFNPYNFTVGWEHKLWKEGVNLRVRATINVVKFALAAIYTLFIFLNVLMMIHQQKIGIRIIWSTSTIAGIFWAAIWLLVFRYLRSRTLEDHMPNAANSADAKSRGAPRSVK